MAIEWRQLTDARFGGGRRLSSRAASVAGLGLAVVVLAASGRPSEALLALLGGRPGRWSDRLAPGRIAVVDRARRRLSGAPRAGSDLAAGAAAARAADRRLAAGGGVDHRHPGLSRRTQRGRPAPGAQHQPRQDLVGPVRRRAGGSAGGRRDGLGGRLRAPAARGRPRRPAGGRLADRRSHRIGPQASRRGQGQRHPDPRSRRRPGPPRRPRPGGARAGAARPGRSARGSCRGRSAVARSSAQRHDPGRHGLGRAEHARPDRARAAPLPDRGADRAPQCRGAGPRRRSATVPGSR